MIDIIQSLTDGQRKDLWDKLRDERDYDIPGVAKYEWVTHERVNSEQFIIFKAAEIHYQLNGYYDSLAGTTWDDLSSVYQVKAVPQVTVRWERA